jgi:hypothetical protein
MWRRLATPTAAVAAATATMLVRQTHIPALNSVWAEDGTVFLHDAFARPAARAVFHTYAGYLHITPRLLAELATLVPLRDASAVMSGGAAFVVAVLALVVFRASGGIMRSVPARVALAASMVALPAAGFEIANVGANLHWYLNFAAFWALLWRPRSRSETVLGCVVVAAAALSDPLSVVLVPLALARLVALRSRREWWLPGAFLVGLVVQFGFAATAASNPLHLAPDPGVVAKVYGLRVAAAALFGDDLAARLYTTLGWVLGVGAAVVVACLVAAGVRGWNARRWVIALCAATSIALFVLPMGLRWEPSIVPVRGADALGGGWRYVVGPVLLLISMMLVLADQALRRGRTLADVAAVGVAVLAFTWGPGNLTHNERSGGPTWRAGLVEARKQCAGRTTGRAGVVIPPRSPAHPWLVQISCRRLG